MTMLQVESKVKEQYERFRRELPVMQRGPEVGRWVLYLDGPKGYFDSEDEAYEVAADLAYNLPKLAYRL